MSNKRKKKVLSWVGTGAAIVCIAVICILYFTRWKNRISPYMRDGNDVTAATTNTPAPYSDGDVPTTSTPSVPSGWENPYGQSESMDGLILDPENSSTTPWEVTGQDDFPVSGDGMTEAVPSSIPLGNGAYDNSREMFYDLGDYGMMYVGLGEEGLMADALYLDLNCVMPRDRRDHSIGYYISVNGGILEYSRPVTSINWATVPLVSPEEMEKINEYKGYIFDNRLFSEVIPADFRDFEDYGVRWKADKLMPSPDGNKTTVKIRGVDLFSKEMLFLMNVDIQYDPETGTYSLDRVRVPDNDMNSEERAAIIQEAITFAETNLINLDNLAQIGFADTWKISATQTALVEKVNLPYFTSKMLSALSDGYIPLHYDIDMHETVRFGTHFGKVKDLYAVTINVPLTGIITIYFAPWYQVNMPSSTQEYIRDGSSSMQLIPIGYDPLSPVNEYTIILPLDWN